LIRYCIGIGGLAVISHVLKEKEDLKAKSESTKYYKRDEIKTHNTPESLWVYYKGMVLSKMTQYPVLRPFRLGLNWRSWLKNHKRTSLWCYWIRSSPSGRYVEFTFGSRWRSWAILEPLSTASNRNGSWNIISVLYWWSRS